MSSLLCSFGLSNFKSNQIYVVNPAVSINFWGWYRVTGDTVLSWGSVVSSIKPHYAYDETCQTRWIWSCCKNARNTMGFCSLSETFINVELLGNIDKKEECLETNIIEKDSEICPHFILISTIFRRCTFSIILPFLPFLCSGTVWHQGCYHRNPHLRLYTHNRGIYHREVSAKYKSPI